MGQIHKITYDLCSECIYRTAVVKDNQIQCNYNELTGRCRIFEKGKRVVPAGYCDKYVKGKKLRDTTKRWCEEAFAKEINIHREGVAKWQT